MKFFIVVLALAAVAVNAQSRLDPFASYFSKNNYRPQIIQPEYQPYVPIVTTTAPASLPPYKEPYLVSQPYSLYQTSTTTRRPYIPIISTPAPTTFPPYNTRPEYTQPEYKPYRPYQTSTTTRRPYIPIVTTSAPATFPPYKSSYLVSQPYSLYQTSTTTRRPYVPIVSTPAPTTFPPFDTRPENTQSEYQPYRPYQTSTSTRRPYIPIVTTPAPPTFSPYNRRPQNVQPDYEPYRPNQTSTTTRRPYIPVVTNSAPTSFPLYNTRPENAQSEYEAYRPYQTSITTRRPYTPIDTASTPTTRQPYKTPSFNAPATKYYNDNARSANSVRSGNEINPNGSYNWFFETDSGIAARAQGTPQNFGGNPPLITDVVEGAFSWIAPNGELIEFTYTADENGYHPKSNAIPTTPPQIARAVQYLNRVAAAKK